MKVQSKPLSKEQKARNRRNALRQEAAAEMKINSGCGLCDQWIAAGYFSGITKEAMHKAHGIHCPMYRPEMKESAPPPRIDPPDTGRLKGFTRQCGRLKKILAATPTREYPPMPSVPLRSYRVHDVLMWAETWRDLYEERGSFLTIQALHNMILHSELSYDDQADAHAILCALYAEETKREAAEAQRILVMMEEAKRLEAEAEVKRVEEAQRQVRIGQRWGIHLELTGKHPKIFGQAVGSVIRWMASDCWTFKEIRKCLNRLGLKRIRNGTIRANWKAAREGQTVAFLTTDQRNRLETVVRTKIKKGRK